MEESDIVKTIMALLNEPDLDNKLKEKDAWQDRITCQCWAEFNSFDDYIDHLRKLNPKWWQIWRRYTHHMKRNQTLLLGHLLYDSVDLK